MKILYELECGNLAYGGEHDAEKTVSLCHIHHQHERIVRVQRSEWLANCYDCAWRRWFGNDQALARDESRRHWLRRPTHKTTVEKRNRPAAIDAEWRLRKKIADLGGIWYNGRVRLPQKASIELPDIPPF
jgi:hypothetical protein